MVKYLLSDFSKLLHSQNHCAPFKKGKTLSLSTEHYNLCMEKDGGLI